MHLKKKKKPGTRQLKTHLFILYYIYITVSSKLNPQSLPQFDYSQQQHVNVSLVTASGTFILLGANTLALSSSSHVTAVCG